MGGGGGEGRRERQREGEREKQRERQTEAKRERQTDRDRQRERERDRQTDRGQLHSIGREVKVEIIETAGTAVKAMY